jgi:small-conductance mechanosensitive channel
MDSIGDLNSESPKAAKRFEQLPVWKRFSLDPQAKGQITSYYQLKDAVDETVRTINLLKGSGQYNELAEYTQENSKLFASRHYISNVEKQMKTMREAARKINYSSLSAEEKRDALSSITQAQINLTRHVQGIKKMVSE